MITPENLPMILTALTSLCSALFWPLLVFFAVLLFKRDLRGLFNRLQTAKLPWGAEAAFQFNEIGIDKTSPNDTIKAQSNSTAIAASKGIKWENTGNLYWLGSDLLWTVDVLLRGGPRELIVRGINQSLHHGRSIGLANSAFESRLSRLLTEAKGSLQNDWTEEKRMQFANELWAIHVEIGHIASTNQPDYKPQANA